MPQDVTFHKHYNKLRRCRVIQEINDNEVRIELWDFENKRWSNCCERVNREDLEEKEMTLGDIMGHIVDVSEYARKVRIILDAKGGDEIPEKYRTMNVYQKRDAILKFINREELWEGKEHYTPEDVANEYKNR